MNRNNANIKWHKFIFFPMTIFWRKLYQFCIFLQFFDKNLFCFSLFWKEKIPYCTKYVTFAKRNDETDFYLYVYVYDDSLG